MEKVEKDWIFDLDSSAAKQDGIAKKEAQKEAILAKLAFDRENSRMTIVHGTSQTVSTGKKDKKGKVVEKQKTLDYGGRDQTHEFDMDEQRDGFRISDALGNIEEWDPYERDGSGNIKMSEGERVLNGSPQEQFQKQLEAQRVIDAMVLQMESEMVEEIDESGKKKMVRLFTDEEIASEIYDPLLRRGLIPETSVPDKFSRTKEMLDGSFEAYAKRLQEEGTKSKFSENKDLFQTIFTSTVSLVGTGLGLDDALKQKSASDLQSSFDPTSNIQNIQKQFGMIDANTATSGLALSTRGQVVEFFTQGMSLILDVGVEGANDIAEKINSGQAPDHVARAPKLASLLVSSAASALGSNLNFAGLGMAVSTTFGTLVKPGPIAQQLAADELADSHIDKIVQILQQGYVATITTIDPKTVDSSRILKAAHERMSKKLRTEVKSSAIVQAMADEKYDLAIGLFSKAAEGAAKEGVDDEVRKLFDNESTILAARSGASSAMEAELNKPSEEEGVTQKMITEHKQKHEQGGKLAHAPQWGPGRDGTVCAICVAQSGDAQLFAGMLDRKIAKLQKDQAILKWSATIGSMAFTAASNVLAPLAIGGSLINMLKHINEAVKRHKDFVAFLDSQASMFRAASAYSAPLAKFVQNAGQQAIHYEVNAAIEATKMIAAIVSCTPAAPIGAGMTVGASVTAAIEAVLYEAKKRYDLEQAWKTYKRALERPENRKLGLIALKKNSTLAKYAVAWGAVIKKDPLVGDFMSKCGLNAETLKDPGAEVDKVVSYLEVRMPDDNVVVGRDVISTIDWAPKEFDLTVSSWTSAKRRGEKRGGVRPVSTRGLEVALGKLESVWSELVKELDKSSLDSERCEECGKLLSVVLSQLMQYTPKDDSDGSSHSDMDDIVGQYRRLCLDRSKECKAWSESVH